MDITYTQVPHLSFLFASKHLKLELLNLLLDILTLLEVLVYHEYALVFAMPAQARLHANDLAIVAPTKEGRATSCIQHVHKALHG